MYSGGIQELLAALPNLDGLTEDAIRRLLTGAWLDVAEARELGARLDDPKQTMDELRRLATALQIHGVIAPEISRGMSRACSFVAAEALDIARELLELDQSSEVPSHYERLLVGLLYFNAGYDANAAVAVRSVQIASNASRAEQYAFHAILALLNGEATVARPSDESYQYLHERVRGALFCRIGDLVTDFTRWLREPTRGSADEPTQLLGLADGLRVEGDDLSVGAHADVQHLARVVARSLSEAESRALRNVTPPNSEGNTFGRFLNSRCRRQPLLWPAAAEFAREALPGPSLDSIIAVPTGAGKSGVADLAIQHAITRGWVIYLAPTNALVGQIRRQLRRDHPGVTVRQFLGGSEYTNLAIETLEDIALGQVLVMTPEKCSLALRQSPEAFRDVSLVILDEAHILGERKGRGVLTELVLAEMLTLAENATLLLMSALIANPDALAEWIGRARNRQVLVIREPWRPTRTLRAVVGIDREATLEAAQQPAHSLSSLPPRRRNVKFDAPLAVLAGLHGPWSTQNSSDYKMVKIGVSTPMAVSRPAGGGTIRIDPKSAGVRPTVEALAQLLGEHGQKVMAFLPRSRHDCFNAALSLTGFGAVALGDTIEALLRLSASELGVESLLAAALSKGAAVHTSALIAEERRASELAFDEGNANVLFATGTLAQGLNLPATTVIVGGTEIGYDPEEPLAERLAQQRSQLLNAIGRAGRARVAARSLALVVPNELPLLEEATVVTSVLPRAEFLAEEDASTELRSALGSLLERLQVEVVEIDRLSASDHVAVSYLATADSTTSGPLIHATWGAQIANIEDSELLALAIRELANRSLEASGGPPWAREAARRAGVSLPVAGQFASYVSEVLQDSEPPDELDGWLQMLISAVEHVEPANLSLLLQPSAFKSTVLEGLWADNASVRRDATEALMRTLRLWLNGESLAAVGGAAHGSEPINDPRRGPTHPIPRTIRLVDSGISFGLARAAGLLVAVLDVAVETAVREPLSTRSRAQLELLPVAIRFGAADRSALALIRAGVRPRSVAHALAHLLDDAPDTEDDHELQRWAVQQLSVLAERIDSVNNQMGDVGLIRDFLVARDYI